jgi:dTDP-4-dehydrorhamnose reductase
MTRVLVLGAGGMLGHKTLQRLSSRFDTIGTVRGARSNRLKTIVDAELIDGIDIDEFSTVRRALSRARPDFVVNCVGIIKQIAEGSDAIASIKVNSLFPHELTAACDAVGARVIHFSTDCVFSGTRGSYRESDVPDAQDLYGRSKLLGEVTAANAITLRTSVIGRELRGFHSLLEWFLRQPDGGAVRGYTKAIFSGLTNIALADEIARLIESHAGLTGVYHLSAAPIAKHDLLARVSDAFGVRREIIPDAALECDRSLVSDRYRQATGFQPASWEMMIQELASDPTPYPSLQSSLIEVERSGRS